MIKRIFASNFRCFTNFEFIPSENHSALLIGHNAAGKSSVMTILEILKRIASGENHLKGLISADDFGFLGKEVPIRFEIEVSIKKHIYQYELALEFPFDFLIPRVSHEALLVDGKPRFKRTLATIEVSKNKDKSGQFALDWHMIGLPIIQNTSNNDHVAIFKDWLKGMILLAPIPKLMNREATNDSNSSIGIHAEDISSWISNILSLYPKSYATMEKQLKLFFPDFRDFLFNVTSKNTKELEIRFQKDKQSFSAKIENLSDGEKCILLGVAVIAAAQEYESPFCFWDEPNNFLAISELDHFIRSLRHAFEANNGQFWAISHDFGTIGGFSDDNTWLFTRKSHMEPTSPLKTLTEMRNNGTLKGDLRYALTSGDIYGDK